MSGKSIGYIRVSTLEQNPDRQLSGQQLDKIFIDYASGTTTDRPNLQAMLGYVREDDHIYVHAMDRLARNVRDLLSMVEFLKKKGVAITFLKEGITCGPLNKSSPMGDMLLVMMAAIAEFELSLIRERQREGIAISKAKGKFKGGKKKLNNDKINAMKELLTTHKSKASIAQELGISRYTLYRYMRTLGIDLETRVNGRI